MVKTSFNLWILAAATLIVGAVAPVLPAQQIQAPPDREQATDQSSDSSQDDTEGETLSVARVVAVERAGDGWRLVDELRWTPNSIGVGPDHQAGQRPLRMSPSYSARHKGPESWLTMTAPDIRSQAPPTLLLS